MKKTLSIRLTNELHERLDCCVAMTGCSKTDLVEEALVRFFELEYPKSLGDRLGAIERRLAMLEARGAGKC